MNARNAQEGADGVVADPSAATMPEEALPPHGAHRAPPEGQRPGGALLYLMLWLFSGSPPGVYAAAV